jgi:polysaccharide deacetylase 2 family uncharacterized protein YibQ
MLLVGGGYYLGQTQTKTQQSPAAKQAISKKSSPSLPKTSTPKASHAEGGIVDFLRYGEMEDALGEALPDISWYEPGKEETPPSNPSPTPKMPKSTPTPVPTPTLKPTTGKRPMLAIIIDDISNAKQLKKLRALPYHITPSIFPPSEISATSHKLAVGLSHYMVHLPLESGSRAMNRMRGMLFAHDSKAKMQARVDEIRRLFPKATFVNNHTGSVFTSNPHAMKQLYGMLDRAGFTFVDSRTSAKSVVKKVAKSYGRPYIARDVFIDNTQTRSYVLKQLKHAVHIAKKRGFAIAIGHPHAATMDALRHAQSILKGVQTVYIDELYH